jgi:N6-adenosine-specific RNA methylase IME4
MHTHRTTTTTSKFNEAAWRQEGIELARREHSNVFGVSEWYLRGKQGLGCRAVRDIIEAPGWQGVKFATIKVFGSLARCYPPEFRYLNLSPYHFIEAMSLARSHGLHIAMGLLQRAERDGRNVNWVRIESRRIRNYRELVGRDIIDDLADAIRQGRKWRGILADPPWQWDYAEGKKGATDSYYLPMPFGELAALPVEQVATDDAFCFLWCQAAMLEEGLALLRAWGFKFKTAACWDKLAGGYGTGSYWRMEHEHVLLGVRPKSQGHFDDPNVSSMIRCKRSRKNNSEKPPIVHEMVQRAIRGPYLEMFARKHVAGWDCYGNQLKPLALDDHSAQLLAAD